MANNTTQPWLDPSKNTIAANNKMETQGVQPVILVGTDGQPYNSSGQALGGGVSVGSTGVSFSVNSSVSSVQLLLGSSLRVEGIIQNDSTSILYIKFGTSASSSSFTISLDPQEAVVIDNYKGDVHGAWSSVNGSAKVTFVIA